MKKQMKAPAVASLDLRVSLQWIRPEIWRLIRVPQDIRMDQLHHVLQVAFGWTNSHLHQFLVLGAKGRVAGYVGQPDPDFPDGFMGDGPRTQQETKHTLGEFLTRPRQRIVYEYDFGDGWHHDIVVAAVVPQAVRLASALVLDGARACPPEDCGGPPGYENFVAIMADPKHPEHEEMLDWIGDEFDPEAFDLAKTNRALSRFKV